MPRLLIVGAGGLGREVLAWARAAGARHPLGCPVAGFLDDRPDALDTFPGLPPILGSPRTHQPAPDEVFVAALGDGRLRLGLTALLRARGARFTNVLHPTALVEDSARLGSGCVVGPFSVVSVNTTLGDDVVVNYHVSVGHDVILGDGCTLSPHACLSGGVILGKGAFLGSNATVLPRVPVGDFAILGAGCVAVRPVAPGTTVIGMPARPLVRPDSDAD